MKRTLLLVLGCLSLLTGCVGGPSYAGGPTAEEPHGVVSPGNDVTIWRVDGFDTETRVSEIYVLPGQRRIKIRIEFPIESEAAKPFEYRDLSLNVEANHYYELNRVETEAEHMGLDPGPPYELAIAEFVFD